jgi:hypothetical protein
MADTLNISRSHLILAICLPVAVLIGFVLAEPLESPSLVLMILVLGVLMVPVLMKWHHPLLICSWNMMLNPIFLPGRPELWMVLAEVSLLFILLNRAVTYNGHLNYSPSITKALFFLTIVVVVTAALSGGVGFGMLGSAQFGGRKYFYLLTAVVGYFALSGRRIPRERAGLYVAVFFLFGLTAAVGDLVVLAGPKFYFFLDYFPTETAAYQVESEGTVGISIVRYSGFAFGVTGIYSYLLSRYGIRGVLDWRRPWRLLLLLGSLCVGMLGGFRSTVIVFGMIGIILFWLEGLHRTWYLAAVTAGIAISAGLALPNVQSLPLSVQRTLSFLPIDVDPVARQSAQASADWRLDLWRTVLPDVPKYLIKGKGYAIDPGELFLAGDAEFRGWGGPAAIVAGDYHSGPLSVLIPFGLFGLGGFLWFGFAAMRVMYCNYRYGDPALSHINGFLLAAFAGKFIFFFVIFGSLFSDLAVFAGLVGMSVSLNGDLTAVRKQRESVVKAPGGWHTNYRNRQVNSA